MKTTPDPSGSSGTGVAFHGRLTLRPNNFHPQLVLLHSHCALCCRPLHAKTAPATQIHLTHCPNPLRALFKCALTKRLFLPILHKTARPQSPVTILCCFSVLHYACNNTFSWFFYRKSHKDVKCGKTWVSLIAIDEYSVSNRAWHTEYTQ